MSDKPRSRIRPVNIDDLKSGWYTKQHNLSKFAKELGINRWALKSYLDRTLKPGIKIFGKRHFSNIDDVAEFLLKKQREIQSKPAESKIIKEPVTQIGQLKNLARAHDMRWRTIQNALDAGANPKSLIRTLSNENLYSHDIEEHLQKTFKKKNAERRARDKLRRSTGSKIVKFDNLDKIAKNLFDYQKQFGTKHGLIPTDTIKQLLQKGYGLERLKTQLEVRLQPPTDWHTKVIDRGFKETLGLIDDKGNPIAANKISAGPNAKWKPMRSLKDLSIDAYNTGTPTTKLTGDNLKLWNAYAEHQNEEWRKWERRTRKTNRNRLERIEDGRARQLKIKNITSGLKGAATKLGAAIAINSLADKFVKPHIDAASTRLGTSLGRWAKEYDEKHPNNFFLWLEKQMNKKNAKKKEEK